MNSSIWTIEERNPSNVTGQPNSNAFIYNQDRTLPDNLSGFRLRDADRFTYPNPSFLYTGDALRGYFTAGTTTEQKDIWIDKQQKAYGMAGHLDLPTLRNVRTTDDGVPVQQVVRDPGAWAGPVYDGMENSKAYPDNINRSNPSTSYSGRASSVGGGGSVYAGSRPPSPSSSAHVNPYYNSDNDDGSSNVGGFLFAGNSMYNDDEELDDGLHSENIEQDEIMGDILETKSDVSDLDENERKKLTELQNQVRKDQKKKYMDERRRKRIEQMTHYDEHMKKLIRMVQEQSDLSIQKQVSEYRHAQNERDAMFQMIKEISLSNTSSSKPVPMDDLLQTLDDLREETKLSNEARKSEHSKLDEIARQISTGINVKLSDADMKNLAESNDLRIGAILEALQRIENILKDQKVSVVKEDAGVVGNTGDFSEILGDIRLQLNGLLTQINQVQRSSETDEKRDELLKGIKDENEKLFKRLNDLQLSMVGSEYMKKLEDQVQSIRSDLEILTDAYGKLTSRSDFETFLKDREKYVTEANSKADLIFKTHLEALARQDKRYVNFYKEFTSYQEKLDRIRTDIAGTLKELIDAKSLLSRQHLEEYLTQQYLELGKFRKSIDNLKETVSTKKDKDELIAFKIRGSPSPSPNYGGLPFQTLNTSPVYPPKAELVSKPKPIFNVPNLKPEYLTPKPEYLTPKPEYAQMEEKDDVDMDSEPFNPEANLRFWNDEDAVTVYQIAAQFKDSTLDADYFNRVENLSGQTLSAISGLRHEFNIQKKRMYDEYPAFSTFYNQASRMTDEQYKSGTTNLQELAEKYRSDWDRNANILIDNYVESNNALLFYFEDLKVYASRKKPIPITISAEIFKHFDVLNRGMTNMLNMSTLMNDSYGTRATGSSVNIIKALAAFQFENERFILFARNMLAWNIQLRNEVGIPGSSGIAPTDKTVGRNFRGLNRFYKSYIEKAKALQEEYSIEYQEGLLARAHTPPYLIPFESYQDGMNSIAFADKTLSAMEQTPTMGYIAELRKAALKTYVLTKGTQPTLPTVNKSFYDNFNANNENIVEFSKRILRDQTGRVRGKFMGTKPSELILEWLQTYTENKAKRREISVDLSSEADSLVELNSTTVIFEEENAFDS